jgi:hypothetical protein
MSIQNNFPAVKPTMLLDFASVKALDPRVTFTRASTGTFYGTQTAKAEENLFIRSQDFAFGTSSATGWSKTRTTVGSAVTAPDGSTTAEPVTQATGQTTSGFVAQTVSVTATQYVVSVFAKTNGKNFLRFVEEIGTGSARSSWIDLSTGTAGTTNAGHTITITASTQGFYRVSIVLSVNAVRSGLVFFSLADSDNSTVVVDSGGLIFWGAQLEQRSAVTAYTATTTQPITNYVPQLLTAASGVARFDHNPITDESLGLLIEEQRTNLFTYSEQFDNAAWTKVRSSITANTIIAPDGTLTGDKLVEDTTATNTHGVNQTFSFSTGNYAYSIYAKAGERTFLQPFRSSINIDTFTQIFNLTAGTATGTGATIVAVGNGWYRCSGVINVNTAHSGSIIFGLNNGTTNSYTGDGYSGLFLWGAQLEAGAFPTSYIPTVASQVTRSADAASMTGANFSSFYNQAEGTLYADYSIPFDSSVSIFPLVASFDNGSANNRTAIAQRTIDDKIQAAIFVNNVSQANILSTANATYGPPLRAALSYKTDDVAFTLNANAVQTDTSALIGTDMSAMRIGNAGSGGYNAALNGHIRKVAYYPLRVSNTNLVALTS